MAKLARKKSTVTLTVEDVLEGIQQEGYTIPEENMQAAREYVEMYLPGMVGADTEQEAKNAGMSLKAYIIACFVNGLSDNGLFDATEEAPEVPEQPESETPETPETPEAQKDASEDDDEEEEPDAEDDHSEQEIIEVSQEEVKKALKALLTTQNDMIALLYRKHDEFNKEFFNGELSIPLITIERLDNRTLGNYTYGENNIPVKNHIRFNRNFIALNTEERILETLKHEMIHQWQDEILYAPKGSEELKTIRMARRDETGNITYAEAKQKKRPKEWHNKDFKEMAAVVGIPAIGAKCYGNPAKMPEPKSYNRKFTCGCVASNGYPVTIWSTRVIHAQCMVCGRPFVEIQKGGKVIEVSMSHVEKPNTDAVHDLMKQKYRYFERFETKQKKDAFIEDLRDSERNEHPVTELEEGIYQKGHNAYQWGYRYWVAYNTSEVNPDAGHVEEVEEAPVEKPARKKPDSKKTTDKKGTEAEDKKKTAKPAKTKGKVVPFPVVAADEPKEKEPMENNEPMEANPVVSIPDVPRAYSVENPQDIIDLYRELGTVRKVAERLGVAQSTVSARIKKYKIDFNAGTFVMPNEG